MPELFRMDHSTNFRTFLALFFGVLISCFVLGQSTFTVKYFGLTIHPFGDETSALQPYRMDKRAHFVANFGGFIGYEKFVYKDLISIKIIQGAFTDCSAGWASVSHVGVRFLLYEHPKHRLYFGIGPTLLIRNSWERFGAAYTPSGYFEESNTKSLGEIQWKFIPYGCEFEYDYRWTEKNNLSISFTPGVPLACIFSVGWKHWITIREFDYTKLYIPKK